MTSNFLRFSKTLTRCLQLTLVLAFISACSSSESNSSAVKKTNRKTEQQESLDRTSSDRSNRNASSSYSPQQQLIEQASLAIEQGLPKEEIERLVRNISPDNFYSIEADLNLAKVYLYLEQLDNADVLVTRLKRGALPTKFQIPLWLVSAQLDARKGEHLNSIRTLFRLSQLYGLHLSPADKRLNNDLIWHNILNLSPSALSVFQYDFGEEVDSWIQLAELIENFPVNPVRFSRQIDNWVNNHALFAQREFLPEQIVALTEVSAFSPNTVALVLPFTGKLAKQAEAIRNGFFATVDFDSGVNYMLLDSASLTLEEIEQTVTENNIDFIVGPLLKENIARYQQSEVLSAVNQLNLNVLDKEVPTEPNNYYFSLSPEDEIEQAVNYFVAKNVKHPAIIYADNSLGRRLFEQFNELWLEQTNSEVESIAFKNKSKLHIAVKDLLDVGISEKRIKQIEQLFGAQIKSEERSRTDIDAIYVIANSQQTRLIKPFFDVNVSKFASLPIYSSSRSYLVGETQSEKLDLNGLTFTGMPWLLSETTDELSQVYAQVGDNNTELKKLFAFGHDANSLIPVLQHLAVLPEVTIDALTGQLSIKANNKVKRDLQWAQYKQGKVVVIKTINQ